jgi:UDP-N-acetylmuramate dehydrogenase
MPRSPLRRFGPPGHDGVPGNRWYLGAVSASTSRAASLRDAGFHGELREEERLAPLTTWKIGGPAELLATPETPDDLGIALRWAAEKGVPWRVLGNGSNLLIRDEGVRGLVLRVRKVLDGVRVLGTRIVAGAGAPLPVVANLAAARGLGGLEFASGIPGTVGGAIVMNAGWHASEIGNVVESVEWLDGRGVRSTLPREDCAFGYRTSAFRGRAGIVLEAAFALAPDDPEVLRDRLLEYAASRKANQPTELPSCGSVFLKPPNDFAGRLIEQAGLKGLRVGGIEVSTKHANFFVYVGGGTARDALALVERVERTVAERFSVRLEREFEVW